MKTIEATTQVGIWVEIMGRKQWTRKGSWAQWAEEMQKEGIELG